MNVLEALHYVDEPCHARGPETCSELVVASDFPHRSIRRAARSAPEVMPGNVGFPPLEE